MEKIIQIMVFCIVTLCSLGDKEGSHSEIEPSPGQRNCENESRTTTFLS
jgi:hypothetical protein